VVFGTSLLRVHYLNDLHGRWAKLLGVRAALHPRLRLQEFLIINNITEEFIAATEKVISFSCLKYNAPIQI
jgi:hypothetical protein